MPRQTRRRIARSPARLLRRRWIWLAMLLAVCAVALLDRRGLLLVRNADDFGIYHGQRAIVTRVIDGDTLEVAIPDVMHDRPVTRIRLWGIDAPEHRRPASEGGGEPLAREATALARSRAQDVLVTLWLEPQRTRGSYGRVLAHVEFADGSSLNELLLESGLARADDRWPHTRMTRYAQLQHTARRKKIGIWAD